MLEKVTSSYVLWYNDEGVYIRACWLSAHAWVKLECGAVTRSINPKAIASECKDFAAGFFHHWLREILRFTDMFDEFHSDLLYKLECRLPESKRLNKDPVMMRPSTLPSLCFFQALEIILVLQLCNESIVGSKLCFGREVLGYWRRDTILLGLSRCHGGCVDGLVSYSRVRM